MSVIRLYLAEAGSRFRVVKPTRHSTYVPPTDPLDAEPYTLAPVKTDGKPATVRKYTLTLAQYAQWAGTEDDDERAAILAACKEPRVQKSPVKPTFGIIHGIRRGEDGTEVPAETPAMTALPTWSPAMLAAGILAVPSDAAEASAATSRKSAEDAEAEALAELFPAIDDVETAEDVEAISDAANAEDAPKRRK